MDYVEGASYISNRHNAFSIVKALNGTRAGACDVEGHSLTLIARKSNR